MSDMAKRNGWTIARFAGDRSPDRTQRLLNRASWDGLAAMSVAVTRSLDDERRWEVRSAGKGSKGDRWYAWAWIGTSSPGHHVLVRRHVRTGEAPDSAKTPSSP